MVQVADLTSLEDAVGRDVRFGASAHLVHEAVNADKAFVVGGKPRRVATALRELPTSHRGLQGTTEVMVPSVRFFA